jgi:hypothetical protein
MCIRLAGHSPGRLLCCDAHDDPCGQQRLGSRLRLDLRYDSGWSNRWLV